MSANNFVGKEMGMCMVCGKTHMTGILIDMRMCDTFPPGKESATTHSELCKEHKKMYDDGYIALIAIDPSKSEGQPSGDLKNEYAYRTGRIAHVRFEAFPKLFNTNLPKNEDGSILEMVFVEDEVIEMLAERQHPKDKKRINMKEREMI